MILMLFVSRNHAKDITFAREISRWWMSMISTLCLFLLSDQKSSKDSSCRRNSSSEAQISRNRFCWQMLSCQGKQRWPKEFRYLSQQRRACRTGSSRALNSPNTSRKRRKRGTLTSISPQWGKLYPDSKHAEEMKTTQRHQRVCDQWSRVFRTL